MDLETHTWLRTQDDAFVDEIFSAMDDLFSAYGWADDEFSWTNATTVGGGTVLCAFASPSLSFWALLSSTNPEGGARPVPANDRGIALDPTK